MTKPTEGVEYIIEPSESGLFHFKELKQYRELFFFFTWRDIKVKYKQTSLGIIWVVLQPVLSVAIFSFFFGRALAIPESSLPYPVFVFSGVLLWNFFAASINSSGISMLTNAAIVKKIYFPRIIIPISAILVSGIDFVIAFVVFLFFLLYYQVNVSFIGLLVYWPMALALMFLGTLGISCWLAALNVKYRDFRHIIPFGLNIAFFVSPVIYPAGIIANEWLKLLIAVNPMYGSILLFRAPLTGFVEPQAVLISVLSTLIFFIFGIYYFKKTEAYFADLT
jgi:lipopolysaccharide transport system permease protein